ncbi:hypothetical protein BZL30_2393 [Mycobacterium kansasii]|uniref:Uncharacterized protein n=1 Tax=Mycobacterium kansasii TaxID=1768 RepID=A0A1V3XHI9_MYCKA|nr:hypothetical protein BZL30_2393 [Mycobacterium kansasii]
MHIHVNQLARRSACATLHSAEVTFMLPRWAGPHDRRRRQPARRVPRRPQENP